MAFTPILTARSINSIRSNMNYRNASRENYAGAPVFFTPSTLAAGLNGFGGPKYVSIEVGQPPYYNYDNSPSTWLGNCTWWCCGRLYETTGKNIRNYFSSLININASNWYNIFTGDKDPDASNIQAGDIIVFTDGGDGHVMFVEQVVSGTIYISHSAYSQRSVWQDKACLVTTYSQSSIYEGASIDMYKDNGSPFYVTVVGVIHTGEDTPEPPQPTKTRYAIFRRLLLNRRKRGTINVNLFK